MRQNSSRPERPLQTQPSQRLAIDSSPRCLSRRRGVRGLGGVARCCGSFRSRQTKHLDNRRAHQTDENAPRERAAKAIGPRHFVEGDESRNKQDIGDRRQNEGLDREPQCIQPAVSGLPPLRSRLRRKVRRNRTSEPSVPPMNSATHVRPGNKHAKETPQAARFRFDH